MIQVLHLSSRWDKFLVFLFISIQSCFSWVAGCHLIIWDVFHKTISRLFFSLLVFNNSILAFVVTVLSQDLVSLRSGVIVMLLFSLLISACQDHVQFLPFTVEVLSKLYQSYSFSILFNRSVVSSPQVLFILSSIASLFNRSAIRICSSLFLLSIGVFSILLFLVHLV